MADLFRITSEVEQSKTLYEKSILLFDEIKSLTGKVQVLRGHATLLYALGDYEKSENYLTQCLSICDSIQDKVIASRAYIWKGKIQSTFGNYMKARDYFEKGIELCDSLNDKWGKVQLLTYPGDLERE
jgi:tetratricopeptide (TPR) repeat protein